MAVSKKSTGKTAVKKNTASRKKLPPDNRPEIARLWLMYPQKLITTPIVWELGHKFKLVTNVRQASVNEEIGLVSIELRGTRNEIKQGIKWLERKGVKVEPVEINVIES
jgi:hypothetical protein